MPLVPSTLSITGEPDRDDIPSTPPPMTAPSTFPDTQQVRKSKTFQCHSFIGHPSLHSQSSLRLLLPLDEAALVSHLPDFYLDYPPVLFHVQIHQRPHPPLLQQQTNDFLCQVIQHVSAMILLDARHQHHPLLHLLLKLQAIAIHYPNQQ